MKKLKVALAGNPNSGKSQIFNNLTGQNQRIGNWPGVTVEKKSGNFVYKDYEIEVVDLPGIYSLTPYSLEEKIVREFLINEEVDIIINVVDSTNLERHLFLTSQLLSLNKPLILVLNFWDEAEKKGIKINTNLITKMLNTDAVKSVANKNIGTEKIKDIIIKIKENKKQNVLLISKKLKNFIFEIEKILKTDTNFKKLPLTWTAIKILEKDKEIIKYLNNKNTKIKIEKIIKEIEKIYNDNIENIIVEEIYSSIYGLTREVIEIKKTNNFDITKAIDKIILNKYLGLPIFFTILFIIFKIIWDIGLPLTGFLSDNVFGPLEDYISILLKNLHVSSIIISFIVKGLLDGIASVLVFFPLIALFFFITGFLEDTGYIARAAFVSDKIMHSIGLHGRSFISILIGFGCNVPAITGTRILTSPKAKITTILLIPFSLCSARLEIFMFLTAIFFDKNLAPYIIFSLYILSFIAIFISGYILNKYIIKEKAAPFIMELPPYRIPTLYSVLKYTWSETLQFLQKAGTVIIFSIIIIWFLSYFPKHAEYAGENSYIGKLGKILSPITKPLGFNWQQTVGLIFGVSAKEIVISTMGILYKAQGNNLTKILKRKISPISAYSYMIFLLLYVPCIATLAAIKNETNSYKWPFISLIYSTTVAYIFSFIFYNLAKLIYK